MHILPDHPSTNHSLLLRMQSRIALDFQPISNNYDLSINGYEAIIRRDPATPALLSSESQIRTTDHYLLGYAGIQKALQLVREKGLRGLLHLPYFGSEIADREYYETFIIDALKTYHIPHQRIVLVFSMALSTDPFLRLHEVMGGFRYHGFRTALENFSGNASSVKALGAMNPDYLKLDQRLLQNVHHNKLHQYKLNNLIHLCHKSAISLIACGITNEKDIEYLQKTGIRLFQPYVS